ncbi:MAG: hypothetical protein GVY32_06445 [Gammaproteobacteria bacterium]|jgi:hypothetical protein|nr:hypothetical protein [Gammaproteobacteria bacterium]NBD95417.1 hypothetical protein [Gammaproteobacteria bacterium]
MSELFDKHEKIEPVWNVIPQFFRYPFKSRVLPTLLFISLGSLLTMIPVLGIVAWLMLWAMLFKISYEILSSTATGQMEGPPDVTEVSGAIMFKHIGLLLALAGGYVFVISLIGSPLLAILLGAFVLLATPAAMMTLAMTQSLMAALNPSTWLKIMRVTGMAYVLTSVFLLLMLFSQAWIEQLLLPMVGETFFLLNMVSWFISGYFMAASFHLMGYLLYQFHEELGIEGAGPQRSTPEAREDPLIAAANERIREGRAEEAVDLIEEEIARRGVAPEVHEYYRKLLRNRADQTRLAEHGQAWIPVLLHAVEDHDRALEVAGESLEADPKFRPRAPGDVLPLVRRAHETNRHRLALHLASGFGKSQPRHPDLPEIYFRAAQSLIETGGNPEKAVRTVRQLQDRFPDHPLADEMARFERSFAPTRP